MNSRGASLGRLARTRKTKSFFAQSSAAIDRQDSMKLGDLNLQEHLLSSKTLLLSPAYSTAGSDLVFKSPKGEHLPKGAVVVMPGDPSPVPQERLIHQQLYGIERHVSPGRGIVYEVLNSPIRPPPEKTIVKRMILEQESALLKEKKVTKILDNSRSSDLDHHHRSSSHKRESMGSQAGGGAIPEIDQMPSLDLPAEMKPGSFQRVKLQRNLFGGTIKETYYGRACSIDVIQSKATAGTRHAPLSPKFRKPVPQDKYYDPNYRSQAKHIYSAWRANPSARPPVPVRRLAEMGLEEFTHKYEMHPRFYRPRTLVGLPVAMPVSSADFATLRASFHIQNGQLKLAQALLQNAHFSEEGKNSFGVIFNLGLVYFLHNQTSQASELFQSLYRAELHTSNPFVAWNYAIVLLHESRFEQALYVVEAILKYFKVKAELDGLKDGDAALPRDTPFFRLFREYLAAKISGPPSPPALGAVRSTVPVSPFSPINAKFIKDVASTGQMPQLKELGPRSPDTLAFTAESETNMASGKTLQLPGMELMGSQRRLEIDEVSNFMSESGSPFKVLRFDQFHRAQQCGGLRSKRPELQDFLGMTGESMLTFAKEPSSSVRGGGKRFLSEKQKRTKAKKQIQAKRLQRFEELITDFSSMFGLDKKKEEDVSHLSLGLSGSSYLKTQGGSRTGSPNLQSRPITRQGGGQAGFQEQVLKDSLATSSMQHRSLGTEQSGTIPDEGDQEEEEEESVHEEEEQNHFIQLLPREVHEKMTYSELLHEQRGDQRDLLRQKTYELQKLSKQYYHNMYTKQDPLTQEYNSMLGMLKDAGYVLSPWGDKARRPPSQSRYSPNKKKLRPDSKQAIAERLGAMLNMEKDYHLPNSGAASPLPARSSLISSETAMESEGAGERAIVMRECGISAEELGRRRAMLDEHEAAQRQKIESRVQSRLASHARSSFEKDTEKFLEKLEEEVVHQVAPRTCGESTLFRFDESEFEKLEEFTGKIGGLLNKNNEIEEQLQAKRALFMKRLQSPVTAPKPPPDEPPRGLISGRSLTSKLSLSHHVRSKYSSVASGGTTEFPLPNFQELVKRQGGNMFSGVSFVNEIQEANANNLLRAVVAQSLEKVMQESGGSKAEWLQRHKLEYVNLQILRQEFAKKELLQITANTSRPNLSRMVMSRQSIGQESEDTFGDELKVAEQSSKPIEHNQTETDTVDYDLLCSLVKPLSFFRSLKTSVIKKLLERGHYFIAGKDCEIDTSQGDQIYIILSGSVATRKRRKDGCFSFTMNSLYDGYTFGRDNAEVVDTLSEKQSKLRGALRFNPKVNLTSFWALESCDLLRVNRKMFSRLMFAEMKQELRKKISILRQTRFFEDIDPYALLILACNVDIQTYKYGSILSKQGRMPDTFFILYKGKCNVVAESIMVRKKEVSQFARKCLQKYVHKDMHFGKSNFLPLNRRDSKSIYKTNISDDDLSDEPYPFAYMFQLVEDDEYEEEEDFTLERADSLLSPPKTKQSTAISAASSPLGSRRKQGGMSPARAKPVREGERIKGVLSPMTHVSLLGRGGKSYESEVVEGFGGKEFHDKKLFGYRQQIQINQLTEGAQFGSRALVDKQSIKSYIFYHASDYGIDMDLLLSTSGRDPSALRRQKTINGCNESELERVYHEMMISQVSVVADSAEIEVVSINKRSLDYLNDEIKNYIKRVVFEKNFKDEDRPFPDEQPVRTLEKRQRTWVDYKLRLTEAFMKEHSRKKQLEGKDH